MVSKGSNVREIQYCNKIYWDLQGSKIFLLCVNVRCVLYDDAVMVISCVEQQVEG